MRIQAEPVALRGDEGKPAAAQSADQPLRVIRVNRRVLVARAAAAERRKRREEREARRTGRRRGAWLFGGRGARSQNADALSVEPPSSFTSNVVVSAKYSAWNFVPRVLLAQLQRPSNVYFLFIAVLQTIKEVSNTSGIPTILLPLAVVSVCSAIKEALEDRERHRADRVANSRAVLTLSASGVWEQRQWGDLRVGDIVQLQNNETVPADLFLLTTEPLDHDDGEDLQQSGALGPPFAASAEAKSSETTRDEKEAPGNLQTLDKAEGAGAAADADADSALLQQTPAPADANLAYIETKSLDGETNLKIRTAIPVLASLCRGPNGLNGLRGVMACELPNNRITSFEGTFSAVADAAEAQELGLLPSSGPNVPEKAVQGAASLMRTDTSATDGSVRFRVPVTAKQMLLRSCVLRNTRAVTGMVVFTGHETKVFCSNTEPVVKTSTVERRLNRLIIGVVLIQQLVCFLGALLGAHWMHTQGDSFWYLLDHEKRHFVTKAPSSHPLLELAKLHLRYFIILQNFVPISLNVSLEFVKYWQAYFMEQDLGMYDPQSDAPAVVRSSALNEDLGRVHHVFTDKTGTLTMNLMLFRFCMVGGKHYGGPVQMDDVEATESFGGPSAASSATAKAKTAPQFVAFDPSDLFADIGKGDRQAATLRRFLRHLALCHTLIPTKSLAEMCSTTRPEYSASSPDEQALVSAAAFCNVRFVHRTPSAVVLVEAGQAAPSRFKLLNVLEFNSDRKRMTVIVETPEGDIELLCKGADNVVLERLAAEQSPEEGGMAPGQAAEQLTLYAKAGMRTLCLGYKRLGRLEYEHWNARFTAAHASMEELVKRRQGRANAIDPLMDEVERDLVLLGVTAVQDKLQAGVPETLRLLEQTKMKVWTLTGDKMETAVNIGYASALLSDDMDVQQVGSEDYAATAAALQELAQRSERASFVDVARTSGRQRGRRRSRGDDYRPGKPERFLVNVKASATAFFFGSPKRSKQKKTKRRRSRSRRPSKFAVASGLGPAHVYSSIPTTVKHDGTGTTTFDEALTDDEDAGYASPEYGSLSGILGSGRRASETSRLALVIDGCALEFALRPELRSLFYQVVQQCAAAVICCRVSPKQKADIVEFVREFEPDSVTLAIGDGANDVAMIQAAHIGVGISGQEGAQAVNASDYALAQFRFLQRLLFVHGRWAYRRVAKLMSYMLYKNVAYVLTTFWFGCFSGFSGQPLILDVAAQSFNVLYTSVPLVLFAVFDQDVSSESAAKFPYLYALGQRNVLLRRRVFWPWILNGIWHSLVIFFVSAWAFEGSGLGIESRPVIPTPTGKSAGTVTLGFVVFTSLVVVVNLKLCLEAFLLTWHFLVTIAVSMLLWVVVGSVISLPNAGIPQAVGEMEYLDELPTFWLLCALVVTLSLLRDTLWKLVRRLTLPSTYHILQERELLGLPNSPRQMMREHRRNSLPNLAWSDVPATVVDYAKMFRQMPRLESPEETLMRSSPLGERLIAPPFSSTSPARSAGAQQTIRPRSSFHATESTSGTYGSWEGAAGLQPSFLESPGSVAASAGGLPLTSALASTVGGGGCQRQRVKQEYHGYAFSEDEHVDSDVEAAASSTARDDPDKSSRSPFTAHAGSRSIKKMLKSVRGTKNA